MVRPLTDLTVSFMKTFLWVRSKSGQLSYTWRHTLFMVTSSKLAPSRIFFTITFSSASCQGDSVSSVYLSQSSCFLVFCHGEGCDDGGFVLPGKRLCQLCLSFTFSPSYILVFFYGERCDDGGFVLLGKRSCQQCSSFIFQLSYFLVFLRGRKR